MENRGPEAGRAGEDTMVMMQEDDFMTLVQTGQLKLTPCDKQPGGDGNREDEVIAEISDETARAFEQLAREKLSADNGGVVSQPAFNANNTSAPQATSSAFHQNTPNQETQALPMETEQSSTNQLSHITTVDENTEKEYAKRKRKHRKKNQKAADKLVISIHRHNVLTRVVVANESPYLCGYCGMAFTHVISLKRHVTKEHFYVEPKGLFGDGIGEQIVMKRTFFNKPLSQRTPKTTSSASKRKSSRKTVTVSVSSDSEEDISKSDKDEMDDKRGSMVSNSDDGGDDGGDDDDDDFNVDEARNDQSSNSDSSDEDVGSLVRNAAGEDTFHVDDTKSKVAVANKRTAGGKIQIKERYQRRSRKLKSASEAQSVAKNSKEGEASLEESYNEPSDASSADSSKLNRKPTAASNKQQNPDGKAPRRNAFACIYCPVHFASDSAKTTHHARVHGEYQSEGQAQTYSRKYGTDGSPPEGEHENTSDVEGSDKKLYAQFTCKVCRVFFNEQEVAQRHMRCKHCGEGDIKCDTCTDAIRLWKEGNMDELLNLVKRKEGETTNDKEAEASEDASMNPGAGVSGEGILNIIDEESSSFLEDKVQDLLKRSLERTNMVGSNIFLLTCAKCGEEFFKLNHLQNHYKWHEPLSCEECGEGCQIMRKYVTHHSKVHNTVFFKCRFCEMQFKEQGKLNYHMLGHLGFFQCIICGLTLFSKISLQNHLAAELQNPLHVQISDSEYNHYSPKEPYLQTTPGECWKMKKATRRHSRFGPSPCPCQCQVCGRMFNMKSALARHVRSSHPSESFGLIPASKQTFCCDRCGAIVVSKLALRSHMKSHMDGNLKCTYLGCDMTFTRKAYLTMHLKAHQEYSGAPVQREQGTFQCNICQKMLKTEPSLHNHMRLHNGTVPQFPCHYCDKVFRSVTHRNYHEKQHTGELDQVCKVCNKRFSAPSTLKVHLLTHSTHKPFKCQHCDRAFPTMVYLRAHTRSHTKPFKCTQCGEGFSTQSARRNHLQKLHSITELVQKKPVFDNSHSNTVELTELVKKKPMYDNTVESTLSLQDLVQVGFDMGIPPLVQEHHVVHH